jgi:hypothetical protein
MRIAPTIVLAALSCLLGSAAPAWAEDGSRLELREWGIRAGGGISPKTSIQYYAIHPYVGLSLWDPASRWFEKYRIHALWMIEPWVAYVDDDHGPQQTESFEIGVSPLFGRLALGDGPWRPFLEGGEGIVYTDLRKQDLGTRVQFTSQVGGGLEYELRPGMTISLQVRARHMSNAHMASSNPGLNTIYGLLGLSFH